MNSHAIIADEFTILLRAFNQIIANNPTADKIKSDLLELKKTAESSVELNARQKDAIIARCNNYLKAEYGNTKKAENYGHIKAEK